MFDGMKEKPWEFRARREYLVASGLVPDKKTSAILSDDPPAPAKPTLSFCLSLQKSRVAKKLTQKQLAQKMNVQQAIVQGWESGKQIPTGPQKSTLNRLLNTTLPKT